MSFLGYILILRISFLCDCFIVGGYGELYIDEYIGKNRLNKRENIRYQYGIYSGPTAEDLYRM